MNPTFKPYSRDVPSLRWRRRLPHWEQPGCTYFVTFRTADSLPKSLLRLLKSQRSLWLKEHPPPWDRRSERAFVAKFIRPVERWLDIGFGKCHLAQWEISKIVESTLRHFDGLRYVLDEYSIMPTHVHSLVLPLEGIGLSKILASWKGYSGARINRVLRRKGRFWMEESFDRIVRDTAELGRYRRYIRTNPMKAGLIGTRRYRLGCGRGIK